VVPPDVVLGGEYRAVLPVGTPKNNEFDTDVGMVAKGRLPPDVTPPTVLLGEELTVVLGKPKENEFDRDVGMVAEDRLPTDVTLPVVLRGVEWTVVLGGVYIEKL